MRYRVCRSCGGVMTDENPRINPNVCASCEQLLDDDCPQIAALLGGAAAAAALSEPADLLPVEDGEHLWANANRDR